MLQPVYRDSLYQNGTQVTFLNGDALLYAPDGKPRLTIQESIIAGDGVDFIGLAYKYYAEDTGDPRPYWALIALANPHIQDPFNLPLGETINIPAFQKWPISLT